MPLRLQRIGRLILVATKPTSTPDAAVSTRVRRVLKEYGHLATDATTLGESEDLYGAGMTSHSSVNVMLALENEFEIEFPDQMLNRGTFESVASIAAAIESLLPA